MGDNTDDLVRLAEILHRAALRSISPLREPELRRTLPVDERDRFEEVLAHAVDAGVLVQAGERYQAAEWRRRA